MVYKAVLTEEGFHSYEYSRLARARRGLSTVGLKVFGTPLQAIRYAPHFQPQPSVPIVKNSQPKKIPIVLLCLNSRNFFQRHELEIHLNATKNLSKVCYNTMSCIDHSVRRMVHKILNFFMVGDFQRVGKFSSLVEVASGARMGAKHFQTPTVE